MDEAAIPGRDDAGDLFKQVLAYYDAPAYVRRARRVQETHDALLAACRRRRDDLLPFVRLYLGRLFALAGDWRAVAALLADPADADRLARLFDDLRPEPRVRVAPTPSPRALRAALAELIDSLEAFNRRWRTFLAGLDLGPANEARDLYNRYYLLEKECAVRSPRVARQGYNPQPPLTPDDLARAFPPLPVPRPAAATPGLP